MAKKKPKYACQNHADRAAVVDRAGRLLCWQCYLGDEAFFKRFGPDFYNDKISVPSAEKGIQS